MKKNITINIFGQLYAFDEDAYELLKNYEDSLRSAFSSQPGGHEIADDIEARIAELLNELKANGVEAITIEHVQDIIKRIGTPEDITGNDDELQENLDATDAAQQTQSQGDAGSEGPKPFIPTGKKRLYRDANNKMLAGVLGGLAGYFNHDATFWRIGYAVLLAFCVFIDANIFGSLSAFLIIGYIVMAILLPVAKTPEDRLRMKGVDVTPQSLAQEVMDDSRRNEVRNENQEVVNRAGGCILKGCLISIALLLIIPLVFVLIAFDHAHLHDSRILHHHLLHHPRHHEQLGKGEANGHQTAALLDGDVVRLPRRIHRLTGVDRREGGGNGLQTEPSSGYPYQRG